jgi:Arc/MetJ family transcription regulator
MDTAIVVVPAELHAELDNLSRETGRPEDELVAEALKAYMLRYRMSRFASLGAAESDNVTGENSEDWLLANWNPD